MTNLSNLDKENQDNIRQMIADFHFWWNKIALIGNRGHQNLWDELILIGNIKLIESIMSEQESLADKKSDYNKSSNHPNLIIYSASTSWLKEFHRYFNIQQNNLIYVQELPHGFRSFFSYVKSLSNLKSIKHRFDTDTYMLGGGEIFTPETPFSYQYWTISLVPYFFGKLLGWMWWYRPKLLVMWGIQKPIRLFDRICFWLIWRCADWFYLRDKESVQVIKNIWPYKKALLFMDSSYFAMSGISRQDDDNKISIFNTNPLSDNLDIMTDKIKEYHYKWYKVYFLPAYFTTHGAQDDMSVYRKICDWLWDIDLEVLDWREWDRFLDIFKKADFVYASRLHIYLIARFVGLEVEPFKYQKKLQKMIDMLDSIGL